MSSTSARVKVPRGRPLATWVSGTVAVLAIAFAAATVRDLAVSQGWTRGRTWTSWLIDRLDTITATHVVGFTGIAVAVIGLALVVTALLPARRTHDRSAAAGDLWIRPSALVGLAARAAERTPGVFRASAAVQRRTVVVRIETHGSHDSSRGSVEDTVRDAVGRAVDQLTDRRIIIKRRQVSPS